MMAAITEFIFVALLQLMMLRTAGAQFGDFHSNSPMRNFIAAQKYKEQNYVSNGLNELTAVRDLLDPINIQSNLVDFGKVFNSVKRSEKEQIALVQSLLNARRDDTMQYSATNECTYDVAVLLYGLFNYTMASLRKCDVTDCHCLKSKSDVMKKYSPGFVWEAAIRDSAGHHVKYCTIDFTINLSVDGSFGNSGYTCGPNNTIANSGDAMKNTHKLAQTSFLKYGICMPNNCQGAAVKSLLNRYLINATKGANVVYQVTCHEPQKIGSDPIAIAALATATLFLALMLSGTMYDWFVYKPALEAYIKQQQNEQQVKDDAKIAKTATETMYYEAGLFLQILMAFSVYTNGPKVFSTEKRGGQLDCMHGIRFISMTWVILGHTYYFAANWIDNLKWFSHILEEFGVLTVINATVSVDTFFTLSGLLLTYLWMMQTKKENGKNIKNPKHWILFYVHRFLRLTPAYMLTLFMDVGLFQYLTNGPLWKQSGYEPQRCANTWWMNLLYINNFQHITVNNGMCFGWSWYLANDMQFYWLSPLFLILFTYIGFFTLIPCAGLMVMSAYLQGAYTINNNIAPNFLWTQNPIPFTSDPLAGLNYMRDMYIRPYMRCNPYLIGMCTGYLLYRLADKNKFRMPKWSVAVGWLVAAVLATWALYGPYEVMIGNPVSKAYIAFYAALCRTAWSLAIAWVIFACVKGYGGVVNRILSWNLLLPFSRLTYCAYLLHELVVSLFVQGATQPIHYDSHYTMIYAFFGHCVMGFSAAFVFSMAFEAPVMTIEKLLFFPPRRPKVDIAVVEIKNKDNIAMVENGATK